MTNKAKLPLTDHEKQTQPMPSDVDPKDALNIALRTIAIEKNRVKQCKNKQ